jgi:ATP-citrate lyase beta-subunit
MARQRISEFRAKSLLFAAFGMPYHGISVDAAVDVASQLSNLDTSKKYIVKVDQGVKKRMKRGLIALERTIEEIPDAITEIHGKGYSQFLIEPMAEYRQEDEKYFAIERVREGYRVSFSAQGGIDIEEHEESVRILTIPYSSSEESVRQAQDDESRSSQFASLARTIADAIGLSQEVLERMLHVFDENHISFLEINPLVIHNSEFLILDLAVEVDSVAEFFVRGAWSAQDFTYGEQKDTTAEELAVEELAANSQAAFTLRVLHPNGAIFMLLSGGGASIVLADEVANLGLGQELANYGEYSGNPNTEETYIYTKQVLSLLLKSQAEKKVLIVGGGVANFTDIKKTFRGVIQAFDEDKERLREQGIKVFVRRGGPNQEEGLALMKSYLEKHTLYGAVVGPDVVLTEIVQDAVNTIQ